MGFQIDLYIPLKMSEIC